MTPPDLVLETASFHGGDPSVIETLVAQLQALSYAGARGVKFHPIAADKLATPDFFAHPIYRQLELGQDVWARLIDKAHPLEVWLEMADAHCGDVLIANRARVRGIKFQPSMIENTEVLERIRTADPAGLDVLLNVSGLSLEQIEDCLHRFEQIGAERARILLQVGFQGYPTSIEDTMLNKLAVIRQAFPAHRLAFADHVAATDPFARIVPALATALGCTLIEKHSCITRDTAIHDKYSALEPAELAEMIAHLEKTATAFSPSFINAAEKKYLADSIQQPALAHPAPAATLLAPGDLIYRRQGAPVLSLDAIRAEQARGRVLAHDTSPGHGVTQQDFRDAKIAVVVACRMKSTRLKLKPKLDIDQMPALDRCLENCLRMRGASQVVLATSTVEQDDVLAEHTLDGRVAFVRGDPEDVMRRYLDAADAHDIDIIVRVTADNPVISPEIADFLIDEHLRSGADFTRAATDAVGTGAHIINVEAMRRIISALGAAPLSEYMNWYFENNPDHFKLHIVDLPADLLRSYRLTLDYQADLDMFRALFAELRARGLEAYTRNVFAVLDEHPEIAALNSEQVVVYQTDQDLIDRLKRDTRMPAG